MSSTWTDEVTLDDELQFFNGPACQEYRELARRFSRPEYVVNDVLKLIANQPSYRCADAAVGEAQSQKCRACASGSRA